MIPPLPSTLGYHFVLVWSRELSRDAGAQSGACTQVDPGITADGKDPTSGAAGSACAPDPAEPVAGEDGSSGPDEGVRDLRRVFQGYQWRAMPHWEQVHHRGLERFVDNDIEDVNDRADRAARERQALEASRREALLERRVDDVGAAGDAVRGASGVAADNTDAGGEGP